MGTRDAKKTSSSRATPQAAGNLTEWKKAAGLVIEAHEKRIAALEAELKRVKGLLHYDN